MKNLTNYQKRFLDKIYPPLLSVPPLEELNRLTKLYRDFLNKECITSAKSELLRV